ncbi:tetratricopeptide repeat protein [Colwellia sp. MEBiC06753]
MQSQQKLISAMHNLQQLLQQKQYSQVISTVEKLQQSYPQRADLYHFKAIALKALGQVVEASSVFKQCLDINQHQPEVHNNYANLLLAQSQFLEAEAHYRKAIQLKADYLDAKKNLSIALLSQKKYEQALEQVLAAEQLAPNDVSILTIKANIYRNQENFELAIQTYQAALQINPNYVNALHNLGISYKLTEQHDYAYACFKKARELAPAISQIDYNLANTLFEQGKYEQAEQFYWSALNKRPNDIEVHQTLNEFYWQRNQKSKFGHSFELAIKHAPNNVELKHAYADSLFAAKQYELAEQVIKQSLSQEKSSPKLLHVLGKIHGVRNENEQALSLFEQAISAEFQLDIALDLINVAIVEADYQKALYYIEQAALREPNNQLLIAYQSTCWRLIGDGRHDWLLDYDKFVKPYQLPVPNGYQNIQAFLEELENVLLGMHQLEQAPLKQTLKHGTQTPGRLLHKKQPVIAALKQGLTQVVAEHINSLPNDKTHPLLSRKSPEFGFAGSWSVRLKPHGFHVNHVHPAGWLSSSFYVSVPKLVEQGGQANGGAIKFGETSMQLGEREQIAKIIQPTAGMLALFPSYCWHGTIPFSGDEDAYRLTSPFDVVPLTTQK